MLVDVGTALVDGPAELQPKTQQGIKSQVQLFLFVTYTGNLLGPVLELRDSFGLQHGETIVQHVRGQVKSIVFVRADHLEVIQMVKGRATLFLDIFEAALVAETFGLGRTVLLDLAWVNVKPQGDRTGRRIGIGAKTNARA